MKSLQNQFEVNDLTEDGLVEVDQKLNFQSLADVVSYPYPQRSQDMHSDPLAEADPADGEAQPRPIVVFVFPTRSERLHTESVRLERQVEHWENEGGHI